MASGAGAGGSGAYSAGAAGGAGAEAGPGGPESASETRPAPQNESLLPEGAAEEIPPFVLDPACQIAEERQQAIYELYHRLEVMDFYELLNLEPGCTARDVQRAYRKIALKYHPDRFYGKELGEYRERLEAIFRHMSNVADYLDDDEQRAAYEAEAVLPARAAAREAAREAGEAAGEGNRERTAGGPEAAASAGGTTAGRPLDTREREAVRASRKLSREERLRRLGGVLGMSTQELKSVARKKGRARTGERPSQAIPEVSDERKRRLSQDRRRSTRKALNPLVQRKQKAKAHFDEGVKAMLAGKWTAAASNLKLATTFDPKNSEYREKERIASARAREESAKSYAKRAAFEAGVGRLDEAARLYKMAAERHESVPTLTQAADALVRSGELKLAVEYATKAKDLNPNSVPARLSLANAYLAASMPKNARREVDYALKLDSDNRVAKALLKEIRKRD
jgi:curved DNA-binding protein CbpA